MPASTKGNLNKPVKPRWRHTGLLFANVRSDDWRQPCLVPELAPHSGSFMSSDFYEVLNLGSYRGRSDLTDQVLKEAYRKALLRHHPDKITSSPNAKAARSQLAAHVFTVDEITTAYKTLSDPALRTQYNQSLALRQDRSKKASHRVHCTGLETVDLDSLDYDEGTGVWSRSCRCGDKQGFLITETELEKNVDDGELTVGCKGCSLWLRVLFEVEDG